MIRIGHWLPATAAAVLVSSLPAIAQTYAIAPTSDGSAVWIVDTATGEIAVCAPEDRHGRPYATCSDWVRPGETTPPMFGASDKPAVPEQLDTTGLVPLDEQPAANNPFADLIPKSGPPAR